VRGDPRSPKRLNDLGQIYAQVGKYAEAVGAYRKAFKLDPTFTSLRANLRPAQFKSGEFHRAIQSFTQAEKDDPHDSRVHTLLSDFSRNETGG
jgi:Flp pilus assembly protein TadD